MSNVTLKPSLPLNDYAKNHLQELTFGPEAPLLPQTAMMERRDLNWFGKSVKKMEKNDRGIFYITRLALTIFLTLSLIGIPLVLLVYGESYRQKEEALKEKSLIRELDARNAKINKRAEIIEKLGLQQFKSLPQLDLQGKVGGTGYIDFLVSNDLASSIMKGTDKVGRAFLSFKLRRVTEAPPRRLPLSNPFVLTLFERYQGDSALWVSGSCDNGHLPDLMGIQDTQSLSVLRRIINGQHPDFKLA